MAGMPIFGNLSNMYGCNRFFIMGLVAFLVGHSLYATVETMSQLSITARFKELAQAP